MLLSNPQLDAMERACFRGESGSAGCRCGTVCVKREVNEPSQSFDSVSAGCQHLYGLPLILDHLQMAFVLHSWHQQGKPGLRNLQN